MLFYAYILKMVHYIFHSSTYLINEFTEDYIKSNVAKSCPKLKKMKTIHRFLIKTLSSDI